MLKLDVYQKIWEAHLRPWSGLPLFPRDMASRDHVFDVRNGKKIKVPLDRSININLEQYISSLKSVYSKRDCYTSVFSDWQLRYNIYDTIFFEIDSHLESGNKEDIISELMFNKYIIDNTLDNLKIGYRYFFTGGRSLHYYLDFEPIFMVDYKATVLKFLEQYKLKNLVDPSVLEPARIARVPHTRHLGTNMFCVYFDDDSIDSIFKISKNNTMMVKVIDYLQPTKILEYMDPMAHSEPPPKSQIQINGKYDGVFPDCVMKIIEKLETGHHATHIERIHLAGYLKRFGYTDEEIVEFFKSASDFDSTVALSQIKSLKGYCNYSCRNIRLQMCDLCPGMCDYIRDFAKHP